MILIGPKFLDLILDLGGKKNLYQNKPTGHSAFPKVKLGVSYPSSPAAGS